MFDFETLPDTTGNSKDCGSFRVYAISDVHTDKKENLELLLTWPRRPLDVLILAGDVSNDLGVLRTTLVALKQRFGHLFYCPGNHDLWQHSGDGCKDSVAKFFRIEEMCEELGVHTRPGYVEEVLIVPLLSWYHASFDTEPDVEDASLLPVDQVMTDFLACRWPQGLAAGDDSIARFMDRLNEGRAVEPGAKGQRKGPVISFSHFLPRKELMPEKRTLYYPPLSKAAGSQFLGDRVRRLAPDLHIFGHTHYGWFQEIEGVRYLQACLAYPRERVDRPFSVCCRDVAGLEVTPPLLVYDHEQQEFPSYHGFWSDYYKGHDRHPEDTEWIYKDNRERAAVTRVLRHLVQEVGARVTATAISDLLKAGV